MSVQKQAHIAFLLFIVGIIVSNKKTQVTQLSQSGYQIKLDNKMALLRSIDQNIGPTYRAICGNILLKQGKREFTLFPEKRFHIDVVNTKVAIHTNWLSDIYMLIGTGSNETGWFLTVMELPFVFCIWFAFVLAAFAGTLSIYNQLRLPKLRWI